jgi:glyoxylase-like metal-dependent hydrolase (beta-lactamase superfamily II)
MNYDLRILNLGRITAPESILFQGGRASKFREIGCFAWLLRTPGENILVDTGIKDLDSVNRTTRGPGKWRRQHQERIETQLASHDLAPQDISRVILTHCHYDHCSNVPLFTNARIYISRKEWNRLNDISDAGSDPGWSALKEVKSYLDNVFERQVVLLEDEFELDRNLRISWVGGHTKGSQWIDVNCQMGHCLLTGDAVFLLDNVSRNIPIGFSEELDRSERILSFLASFAGLILPSHDLTMLGHFQGGGSKDV